jgi:hypothetical protein
MLDYLTTNQSKLSLAAITKIQLFPSQKIPRYAENKTSMSTDAAHLTKANPLLSRENRSRGI